MRIGRDELEDGRVGGEGTVNGCDKVVVGKVSERVEGNLVGGFREDWVMLGGTDRG